MKPTRPDVSVVIDTLGKLCPMPIVETQEAARAMGAGEILEVVSDDIGILADMPAWCKGTGHTLLGIEEHDRRRWHCYVRIRSS